MSASKSEFVLTDEEIVIYVEHEAFDEEINQFITGIASDVWFDEIDDDDPAYMQKRHPTLRFWKRHKVPHRPDLHLNARRFGFIPPKETCLLGPEPQYVKKTSNCTHNWEFEVLKRDPACRCSRCRNYVTEMTSTARFWDKVAGMVKIEV